MQRCSLYYICYVIVNLGQSAAATDWVSHNFADLQNDCKSNQPPALHVVMRACYQVVLVSKNSLKWIIWWKQ